jgi:mannitol-1-phosphate 5-dehydrogenase
LGANKTFLGFGLGAIQAGLMLLEAKKSGNFERFVIVEVNSRLVDNIRNEGNSLVVNIAGKNGIDKFHIDNIEVYNPAEYDDLTKIKEAIFMADEMSTAIPSVDFYTVGKNSIISLLADNINPAKQQILYASENNNYAAEILTEQVQNICGAEKLKNFQALNTVIGKMSGVIQDKETIHELNLDTITHNSSYAVLVEEFNAIIVSQITLEGFSKGIDVFVEKEDLLPFEEAKLFGHNAVHSMLGFLAYLKGYKYMSEIKGDKELWRYGEIAFEKESGAFLLKKYKQLDESLFTTEGFAFYGEDLLERMVNPYLRDEVQRICRDPLRKLGYGDRLVGTIRESLKQDVVPAAIAKGVIAGICFLIAEKIDAGVELPDDISALNKDVLVNTLEYIWRDAPDDGLKTKCLEVITAQCAEFKEKILSV